jgi:hypothetical protein
MAAKVPAAGVDLDGAVTVNESSADVDFRIESDGNANMLFVNGGNNRVGVGCDPSADFHVDSSGGGVIRVSRNSSSTSNFMALESDGTNGTVKAIQELIISAGGGEVARFTSSGLAIGGTGAANTLDDYEEGTYAPVFTVASGSLTPHGSHNALAYTKIGRVVHVQGEVRFSAVSSPSGNFSVSLPFSVADLTDGAARSTSGAIGQSGFGGTPDATYYLRITSEGTATAFFATHNSGSDTGVNANQVSTSTEMILSFTFIAA